MNLLDLKKAVNSAIESAVEYGDDPESIVVSIQVETDRESVYSSEVELHYDNDCEASGCVIVGNSA